MPTDRAFTISFLAHALLLAGVLILHDHHVAEAPDVVDIELAPPPPEVEALPPEVAQPPEETHAATEAPPDPESALPPPPSEGYAIDAGIDALIDAPVDAPIDAPLDAPHDAPIDIPVDAPIDAPVDAVVPMVATVDDAGTGDAPVDAGTAVAIAPGDAGTTGDTAITSAAGSGAEAAGSGAGDGSAKAPGSIAMEAGSGSGVPGQTTEPAVDGAPTTAGTAANLLTYFPRGHVVTALIRFDRLRGTEWAAQTERLLRPMPDYRAMFGTANAELGGKLETLVISSPSPRDAAATTLVGRTRLPRGALRDLLGGASPVAWSTAKGGLLGKRTRAPRGDQRVFLSPFQGWFVLAQPADLGGLTAAAPGDLDAAIAQGKLPAWLSAVRTIEKESGDEQRGPALVLTLGLGGQRVALGDADFGLGIQSVPTPDRVSLAMELVKQGWLVRGNMRFRSERDAIELIAAAEKIKQLVADSRAIQAALGKPLARVIANLSFARTGGRVSYATSISIADARTIMNATAQQLDGYFGPP